MSRARRQRQDGFRPKLIALSVAAAFTLSANQSLANPSGGNVASGSASFTAAGNTLTITNSANAIINWASFSIGVNEITRFLQSSSASAVLNRVVGSGGVIPQSAIDGILQSNGRVFLLNQSGVILGRTATIDAAGFVASSLNLTDQDFLNGRMNFNAQPGTNPGKVSNAGLIDTTNAGPGGRVFLIAPDVENSGIIRTPQGQIVLAAGSSVELVQESSPFVTVKLTAGNEQALNMGSLISDSGRIDMAGALVRNTGVVAANSAVVGANGEIRLVATKDVTLDAGSSTTANGASGGKVLIQAQGGTALVYGNVSATGSSGTGGTVQALGVRVGVLGNGVIDASGATGGGTVLVGGDQHGANPDIQNAQQTLIGPDGVIRADAKNTGDGGRVIVWSDDTTQFYGNISAKGGSQGGNGGFVETSGAQTLNFAGSVDTRAPFGTMGTLLLDPAEIEITAGGTNLIPGSPNFASLGIPSLLSDATINLALNTSSVTVTTSTGDIQVDNGVLITPTLGVTPNSLTLQSAANITWTGNWQYNNNGALNLIARGGVSGGGGTLTMGQPSPLTITATNDISGVPILGNGGAVTMTASGSISSAGFDIRTGGGSVTLSANGEIQVGNIDTRVAGNGIAPNDTSVSLLTSDSGITTGAISTGNTTTGSTSVTATSYGGSVTTGNITTGNGGDTHVSIFYSTCCNTGGIQTGAITTGNATGFDSSVILQTGGSVTSGPILTGSTSFYGAASSVTLLAGLGVTTQNITTGNATGRSFVDLETNQGGISAGIVQTGASFVGGGGNSSVSGFASSGNISLGSITTGTSDLNSYVLLQTNSGNITTGAVTTGNAGTATGICCSSYYGSSVQMHATTGIQTGAIQTGTATTGGGPLSSSFIYLTTSGSVSTTGGSLQTGSTVDGGEGNVVINAGTGVQTGNITTGTTNSGSSATGLSNVSIFTGGGVTTGTILTGSGGSSDAVSIDADSIHTQDVTTASTAYGQSFIFYRANSGDINAGAVTSGSSPNESYIILLASGNVTTGNVQAGNVGAGGEGNVNIFAGGGNINTGTITTLGGGSESFIVLNASGNVTTGALTTGNTPDGGEGNVVISANSGVSTGNITTGTTNVIGSGGNSDVSITTDSGSITTGAISTGSGGNSSAVSLFADSGISTGAITTASTVYGQSFVSLAINSGNISTGNIQTGATSLGLGNSEVSIFVEATAGGNIATGSITAGSSSEFGNVDLETTGNITTGAVTTSASGASSAVRMISTFYGGGGSITVNGPISTGASSNSSVNMNAFEGISTGDITTGASPSSSFIALETTTGDIGTGNLLTQSINQGIGTASVALETGSGNITTGNITTANAVTLSQVFLSAPGTITTGSVTTGTAASESSVTFYGDAGITAASVTTGASPFAPVNLEAINAGPVSVSGGITVATGNTLFLQGGTGGVAVGGPITADDVFVDSAGSASLTSTSNNIGILDSSIVAGDFVVATSNVPTFNSVSAGTSFQWTTPLALSLDQPTFFSQITAPLIRVSSGVGIALTGPITPAAATLSLVTTAPNGFISETPASGGISVMNLNASGGIVTLNEPNSVTNLQGSASAGTFQFTNTGPLNIATADTTTPAGVSGNQVILAAAGGIGQSAPISTANLSVSDSAGDIALLNPGNVIGSLTASSPTNVSVESGTGPMNVVSASAGTSLSLVADSISASGPMTATNIFYTTANPALVISPPSSFFSNATASVIELGDPSLSNTGGISLSGAIPNASALDLLTSGPVSSSGAISVPTLVALGSSVSLSAANNVTTFVGTASAGNLAFDNAGSVSVAAAAFGNVTLISGGDLSGGAANGGTTSLTAAGAIGAPGSPFGVVTTGLGAQAANGITIEMTSANGLPVPVSQLQNTATGDILLNAHGGVITNSLVQNNGGDVTINTFSPMTITAGIDAAGSIFLCTGGPACSPGGTATTGGVNDMTLTGPFTFNTATGQFDVTIGPTGDLTLNPAPSVTPLVLTAELFPNPFDITKFVFLGSSTILPQVQLAIDTSTNSTNQLSNQQGTVDTGDNQQKQDDKKKGAATCK